MSMETCHGSITPAQGWHIEPEVQTSVLVLLQCFTRVFPFTLTRVIALNLKQVRNLDGTLLTLGNRALTV